MFKELDVVVRADSIEVDMMNMSQLLSNCYQMDQSSVLHLYEIFLEVFQNAPILKNLLVLIKRLLLKDKKTIFDQLPAVVVLVLENIRATEGK